jgi:predicted ATP-binding protein involved in virulence
MLFEKGEIDMYITNAKFTNLVGKYDYELTLREGVNILVGPNGTGKTLMLRIMQSIVGGRTFHNLKTPYDEVVITMSDGRILSNPYEKIENYGIVYLDEDRQIFRNNFEWCYAPSEDTLAKFDYFGNDYIPDSFGGRNLKEIISTVECAPIGTIILLDLVEIGLHIEWQEKLVDVLMEIAEKDDKQIILTTHSPNVVCDHFNLIIDKQVAVRKEMN